jgi:hypothetical protein
VVVKYKHGSGHPAEGGVQRFRRSQAPKPMALTPRDLNLLAHVARHRFLTSAQLSALDGGSPQNVVRSLRVLFDHGYLDRPAAHLVLVPLQGTRPLVYALGQRGARALRAHGHVINDRVDWTEKNKRSGAIFVEHTLAVAEFMTRLQVTSRQREDVRLLDAAEVLALAPAATRAAREPLRWKVDKITMGRRETFSVVPDGLFGLRFADDTAAYFALEVDRGTIPLTRNDVRGTDAWRKSIAYKLATYWEGWKVGQHEAQFGVKQMRVAMVTSSPERVEHMIDLVHDLTEGKETNFFLFVDRAALGLAGPLDVEWVSRKRTMVKLTD